LETPQNVFAVITGERLSTKPLCSQSADLPPEHDAVLASHQHLLKIMLKANGKQGLRQGGDRTETVVLNYSLGRRSSPTKWGS
jgi:hypothetical protein